MTYRFLVSRFGLLALIVIVSHVTSSMAGQVQSTKSQAAPKSSISRTPDGQPDLQGIWSFATITPLERPADLAGKEFFTPKEAEAYEKETRERNDKDRRDGPAE